MTIDRQATRGPVMPRACSRHHFLISVALLAIVVVLGGGCGGDDDEPAQREGAAPAQREGAVTEYVGTVRGVEPRRDYGAGDYFVAVAVDREGNAEAYMCDATGNAQLFKGKVQGDNLDLTSQTGEARLRATVGGSTVDGEIELQGKRLSFATTEARGVGGLYTFTKAQGNTITGKSERGNEISARYFPDEQATEAMVTLEGGEKRSLPGRGILKPRSPAEARAFRQQARFRDYRVIVLSSGIAKGNKTVTSRAAPGGTTNYSMTPYFID